VKILKNVKDLRLVLQKKRLLKFKLLTLRELIKKCKLFFKKGYIPKNYRSLKRTFSTMSSRVSTARGQWQKTALETLLQPSTTSTSDLDLLYSSPV
jgi:hypothetical protein